jgi:carbon monoxide dehydrogenase subunit G
MEVVIDKQYPIPASPENCWKILSNVTELATCMPGAAITEQIDDTHYKGQVKVKVGPATAAFAGNIEVQGIDAAAQEMRMLGKGADKGGSSASMQLTASLLPQPDGTTNLVGKASVIVNGKFAQFGGRMMTSVSDMILQQFADNFSVKAQALGPLVSPDQAVAVSDAGVTATPATPVAAPAAAPQKLQTELNGLSVVWMVIKDFFKGLFGK